MNNTTNTLSLLDTVTLATKYSKGIKTQLAKNILLNKKEYGLLIDGNLVMPVIK